MEDTLGKRIVYHRKRIQMTQDQLAEKLGITAQAISKWENDQSCPDIVLLPQLAEVFGISTDALLGHKPRQEVHQAEIVEDENEPDGIHLQKNNWEFHWDSGRQDAIGFALWVLIAGVLYLLSRIYTWDVSLWDILWPTALIMLGGVGMFGRLSFFRISCILFGGFALLNKLGIFSLKNDKSLFWAVLIILFGCSLLADALKKPKKRKIHLHSKNKKSRSDYQSDDNAFTYHARFGETAVPVLVPNLTRGDIQVNFGEYTIDLTQVGAFAPDCRLDASCSFGELRILVPKTCKVIPSSTASFAEFAIRGTPNPNHAAEILLDAGVNFGEITVEYV